jgi:hypothetical protein
MIPPVKKCTAEAAVKPALKFITNLKKTNPRSISGQLLL